MSFKLTSNDSNFNDRVNSLFDSLESASKVHEKLPSETLVGPSCETVINTDFYSVDKTPISTDDFCFKKPFRPKSVNFKKNTSKKLLPDYMKNPNKWTCYNLEDTECKNDAQNQIIASELVLSLKEGNDLPYIEENVIEKKIEFHKTACMQESFHKLESDQLNSSPVKRSSEHFLLPNYEIGKMKYNKLKKTLKKNKTSCKEKNKEIILAHLSEEGFEDELDN